MFEGCISLISLPDISNWNTKNIINMNGLFFNCSSLKSLPDISKWNINNVNDISCMFRSCSSLESLPDISKWKIFNSNVKNDYLLYLSSINSFDEDDIQNNFKITSKIIGKKYKNDLYLENINIIGHFPKSHNKEELKIYFENELYAMNGLFAGCSSLKE